MGYPKVLQRIYDFVQKLHTQSSFGDSNPVVYCDMQGILWYAMEGKNPYGIWNGSSMERKGRFDVWNGTNLPCSILAHFDMVLLKSGFSFS